MITLEEILRKTQKVGKTVIDKANDAYDYTKLSVQSASIANRLEEKYASLGSLVYLEKVKGKDTTIEQEKTIEEISALLASQKEKQTAKAEIKKEVQCPSCGTMYSKNDTFCRNCGAKLQ